MARYDVMLVGSASCDLIFGGLSGLPLLGEEIWATGLAVTVGGIVNSAVAMSRLGLRVGLAAESGTDEWSGRILQVLEKEGVCLDFVRKYSHPYPQVTVVLNQPEDRTFVSYADRRNAEAFNQSLAGLADSSDASIYHITAIPEYAGLIAEARRRGRTISLDAVWDQSWLASPEIREIISAADIFMPNLKEAQTITGEQEPLAALRCLAELVPAVVIKLGDRGSIGMQSGNLVHCSARAARAVDSTGAGDCFAAGFLYGWLDHRDLEQCMEIGNYCGRRSVEHIGGHTGAPTKEQLGEEMQFKQKNHE